VADSAPATGFRGHDGAWPSEGSFLDSRLRRNDRYGACRGAKPLCIYYDPPRLGARGLMAQTRKG